jgi:hypothetical protein
MAEVWCQTIKGREAFKTSEGMIIHNHQSGSQIILIHLIMILSRFNRATGTIRQMLALETSVEASLQ